MRREVFLSVCVVCAMWSVFALGADEPLLDTADAAPQGVDQPSFVWGVLTGLLVVSLIAVTYGLVRDKFRTTREIMARVRGGQEAGSALSTCNLRDAVRDALGRWWRDEHVISSSGTASLKRIEGDLGQVKKLCAVISEEVLSLGERLGDRAAVLGQHVEPVGPEPTIAPAAPGVNQEEHDQHTPPVLGAMTLKGGRPEGPGQRGYVGVRPDLEVQANIEATRLAEERLSECVRMRMQACARFAEEARCLRDAGVNACKERLAQEGDAGEIRRRAEQLMNVLIRREFAEVVEAGREVREAVALWEAVDAYSKEMRDLKNWLPRLRSMPLELPRGLDCPAPEELNQQARAQSPGDREKFTTTVRERLEMCVQASLAEYQKEVSEVLARTECEPMDGSFVDLIAQPACMVIEHIEHLAAVQSPPPGVVRWVSDHKDSLIQEIVEAARLAEERPQEGDKFDDEKHEYPPAEVSVGLAMRARVVSVVRPGYRESGSRKLIRKARVVVGRE